MPWEEISRMAMLESNHGLSMSAQDLDLIVIGGGSAGLIAASFAAGLGARTAMVEKTRLGGECLWTGCVPSKALLHAAAVADTIRHAGEAGILAGPIGRAQARGSLRYAREARVKVQDASAADAMLRDLGVQVFYGDGRFQSSRAFQLGPTLLRAKYFVLATGSRPSIPEIPGLTEAGYLTNTSLFDLEEPPESMVVIGGGPIGVEMAQAFARLGTRVTLVQRGPRLLPRDDEELVRMLEDRLREEGVDVRLGAEPTRVDRLPTGKRVSIHVSGKDETVVAAEVLVATGRRPNVEGLGLEEVGVRLERAGIEVDSRLRTAVPTIWACGDVIGQPQFSHAAEYEAKVVVQNALLPLRTRVRFDRVPWTTFTDPELAHVGLTEAEARRRGLRIEVFRYPFDRDDRAVVDGEPRGLVKLVTRAGSGKLLGTQILGPRAGEVIQETILAMDRGLSARHLADTIHVYPTLSMAVQRAAKSWWRARGQSVFAREVLGAYLRLRLRK
jgi:pyruvate/2-oxoglutarate dehydrogenase complex dihydrolipoamide dehydrogenase (E3) component